MYNSTVNISQTVTDRTNIVIAHKQKVACGLSIAGFKFDLGLLQRSTPQLTRCVARLCTANKRLNLEVPIFAHIRKLTRNVRLQIVIQIVNVLNLHFKAMSKSRMDTFQVHNASEPSGLQARTRRIRGGRTIPIATISRGVRNGGGLPFAKICQGVLAYSLILSEMQRIAFSPIAFIGVCPYLCVCLRVCVCLCVCVFVRLNASLLDRTKKALHKSAIVGH